jgi:hypothetical protein
MRTILLLGCFLSACTDEPGAAPEISELTFSPTTLTAGVQGTVSGQLQFVDPDGDASKLGFEVILPDQTQQTLPLADLQNVGSQTEGAIGWAVIVAPPTPGNYRFFVFIRDAEGHDSNKLEGTLTVQ